MPGARWARRIWVVITIFVVATMVLGLVLAGLR